MVPAVTPTASASSDWVQPCRAIAAASSGRAGGPLAIPEVHHPIFSVHPDARRGTRVRLGVHVHQGALKGVTGRDYFQISTLTDPAAKRS